MRRALGQMDPLLIDGIAAFILFALMAGQFIGTRHLLAGQHPTTVLTWLLAVLIVAPILTHRRFPRASVAVCLSAVAVYATGRYVAYPGLAIFVLTFDIALHSRGADRRPDACSRRRRDRRRSIDLQPNRVAVLSTYIESELGIGGRLAGRLDPAPTAGRGGPSSRPGPNGSSASRRNRPAGR